MPSKQFAGKSRIGQYGDKMMEGDYHVGQVLDALKDLRIDDNTIVVFASDNGPIGLGRARIRQPGIAGHGQPGPFRGELGDAPRARSAPSAFIRWPGHVKPDTTSYAMFSDHGFLADLCAILGGKLPTDRPIDGVDQTTVLTRQERDGHRKSLLTFIGPDLVAARWKQWRLYFKDMHLTGGGHADERRADTPSSSNLYYPKVYNIEMDPHEDLELSGIPSVDFGVRLQAVERYLRSR